VATNGMEQRTDKLGKTLGRETLTLVERAEARVGHERGYCRRKRPRGREIQNPEELSYLSIKRKGSSTGGACLKLYTKKF